MEINFIKQKKNLKNLHSEFYSSAFRTGAEPAGVHRAVDSLAVVLSPLGKGEVTYVKKCFEN